MVNFVLPSWPAIRPIYSAEEERKGLEGFDRKITNHIPIARER